MKLVAISILGLALAAPAVRAQNQETSKNESSKSTAQTADSAKATPANRDRPAAARSRDQVMSEDCMCDCNGKMIKGTKAHPMGSSPSGMDRSRPAGTTPGSDATPPASDATPDKSTQPESPPATPSTPR